MSMVVEHPIPPVADKQSRILILGSFPSIKSREAGFFYGHPQNRFWKMLSSIFGDEVPQTTSDKKALILRHNLALWDVIASCQITGSSDASIRSAAPVDIALLMRSSPIERVLCNGSTAGKLYEKHLLPITGLPAHVLPSTSPANAAWSLEKLIAAWSPFLTE